LWTHLGLVDKLYKRITILAQGLGLDFSTDTTGLDSTDTLVVLGGDPIQSLHTGQLGRRHILLSRSGKRTGTNAVVTCSGEGADDAEADNDGEVESVCRIPGRG
jgi:hypothetical protein